MQTLKPSPRRYNSRHAIITLGIGLTLTLGMPSTPVSATQTPTKTFNSFADWCLHQNNLAPETQGTVTLNYRYQPCSISNPTNHSLLI